MNHMAMLDLFAITGVLVILIGVAIRMKDVYHETRKGERHGKTGA